MLTKQKQPPTRQTARRVLANAFSRYAMDEDKSTTLEWGRRFIPHYFTHPPSKLHKWLDRRLQNRFQKKRGVKMAVIAPRHSAKSTIVTTTYVLKKVVRAEERYVIICSDTEGQAIDSLRAIKHELTDNDQLAREYPHACGEGPVWQETYITMRNGCVIHAIGTGTKIRGRRVRNIRPTLIVLDDPENDTHIESPTQRRKTWNWLMRTLLHLGSLDTNIVALGTALSNEAMLMRLMRTPGWSTRKLVRGSRVFRSIEVWPKRMDLWDEWEKIYCDPSNERADKDARRFYRRQRQAMNDGCVLLWPEMEGLYDLMKMRCQLGSAAFEAEKQGNPINPETCEWPEDYFDPDTLWVDGFPEDLLIRGIALDPSKGKDSKRFDYSSFVLGGIDSRGVVYCDVDMQRRTTDVITVHGANHCLMHNPAFMCIEANVFQSLFAEEFRRNFLDSDIEVPVVELNNSIKKQVRIRRLSPLLAQKRIRFVRSEGSALAVQQLKDFPNADFDDGPDSIEMFCRCAFHFLNNDSPSSNIGDSLKVNYNAHPHG